MRLFLLELKYSVLELLAFSLGLIFFLFIKADGNSDNIEYYRILLITFTSGLFIYKLLYRKEENSERFCVTLPINIRLIPLLRYSVPMFFWIYSIIVVFIMIDFSIPEFDFVNEAFILIKSTGIIVIYMSLIFIIIDKFKMKSYPNEKTRLFIISFAFGIITLVVLFSLLPANVIKTIYLERLLFIKNLIVEIWKAEQSLVLVLFAAVLSMILNIELYVKRKNYLT